LRLRDLLRQADSLRSAEIFSRSARPGLLCALSVQQPNKEAHMPKLYSFLCALGLLSFAAANAQVTPPLPGDPAPIDPPVESPAVAEATPAPMIPTTTPLVPGVGAPPVDPAAEPANGVTAASAGSMKDFQDQDLGQVLRLLARQARINLVVSDKIQGTVTMRLENVTPLEAINVIANSKGLIVDQTNGVYYIKTQEEKAKEPTDSANYTLSYGSAEKIIPLLSTQLQSGVAPQFDPRTNTIFFRETKSNMANILLFLQTIDVPTRQVMIEARLVEVTANPKQSYGINWAGVVGSSSTPQTIRYGGSDPAEPPSYTIRDDGTPVVTPGKPAQGRIENGRLAATDFLFGGMPGSFLDNLGAQFAILSAPSLSATLRLLNEDSDAEFLANPRVVTANNLKAEINITRNQPVPQLNFNEQTATAVFGGFEDKEFGNKLVVTPSINKDNFITLAVKPEISNKVGDATFVFAGATVASPIIDKRTLESNVLIKSGDTLAIGGLLQDETTKARTKVPVLGDIPVVGYLFQERSTGRVKRNLLVFVTPTIIEQGYGTGLEDQVSGLHHSGEEYADPNGWRNNAKGAARLVPTSHRQNVADYPKPGAPIAPKKTSYRVSASAREK
jgi:type IV pilus secretin PilQ/predicted competence protein